MNFVNLQLNVDFKEINDDRKRDFLLIKVIFYQICYNWKIKGKHAKCD